MLLRDGQQRRGKLRSGICATQFLQTILCQFFQYSSDARSGSFAWDIEPFLPLSPGVRISRAGSQGL